MASSDGMINFNRVSVAPLEQGGGSIPAVTGTSTVDIEMVEKLDLTQEQKNEMIMLGLNPDNPADKAQYLNMTAEEKQNMMNASFAQLDNKVVIPNNETSSTAVTQTDVIPAEPENNSGHIHNFSIDTNSPEFANLSVRERIAFVITNGTKAQYSEEEWNAMTDKQKRDAQAKFVTEELNEHIPGFSDMSETEQLQKFSEFLDMINIAEANNMNLKDLFSLKKNNPERFSDISDTYFSSHPKVDLSKSKENRRNTQLSRFDTQFAEYLRTNNLELNDTNQHALIFDFLQDKKSRGERFNATENDIYTNLSKIKAYNNGSLDNIKSGNNNILSLFEDQSVLVLGDNNEISWGNAENRKLITAKIRDRFAQCKTDEERNALFESFDVQAQMYIMSAFSHTEDASGQNLGVKSLLRRILGGTQYAASVDRTSTLEDQNWYACDGLKGINQHNNGQFSPEALDLIKTNAQEFQSEATDNMAVTSYEIGNESMAKAVTAGIGERDDACERFESINPRIAENENISDEMREFYAQNTIEVLKSPEDRQAQADSLGKYNLDSFNKGVQTGYENVARNESSSGNNSSSVSNNVSEQNYPAKICQNPVNNSNSQAQEVQHSLRDLDLSNSDDVKRFLDIVEEKGIAVSNYLAGCSAKDREDFISAYCSNANPKQIFKFLQANPSLYQSILQVAGEKLSPFKDEIFIMLLPNNDINTLASSLDINLGKFAKEHGEYAPEIALKTKNKELARDLVTNPVEYNFNLGDARAMQLRQLASMGNYPERINQDRHFQWARA